MSIFAWHNFFAHFEIMGGQGLYTRLLKWSEKRVQIRRSYDGGVVPPWHPWLGLTVQTQHSHTLQWYVCVCVLVLYRDFDEEVSGNYKKIYDVNASPSHLSLNRLFQKGCEMTLLGLSMFLLVQNSNDMHETRNYNNCIHYKRAYCMYSILWEASSKRKAHVKVSKY